MRLKPLIPRQRESESGIPVQHLRARPTHRVVILGGGFGGVTTAQALERGLQVHGDDASPRIERTDEHRMDHLR